MSFEVVTEQMNQCLSLWLHWESSCLYMSSYKIESSFFLSFFFPVLKKKFIRGIVRIQKIPSDALFICIPFLCFT